MVTPSVLSLHVCTHTHLHAYTCTHTPYTTMPKAEVEAKDCGADRKYFKKYEESGTNDSESQQQYPKAGGSDWVRMGLYTACGDTTFGAGCDTVRLSCRFSDGKL